MAIRRSNIYKLGCTILWCILLLLLITSCNSDIKEGGLFPKWMKDLSGELKLTDISLPGTHNSAADNGLPFIKCQTFSIGKQLEMGIRVLDIRLRRVDGTLLLYHDKFSLNKGWLSTLDTVRDFLKNNPSETVILLVKEESTSIGTSTPIDSLFYDSIKPNIEDFFLATEIPTLREVRGKIVLFRRFSSDISPFGNYLRINDNTITSVNNIQDKEYTGFNFVVQDVYSCYNFFNMSKKWDLLQNFLKESESKEKGTLYVNYLSGTGFILPQHLSSFINEKFSKYIEEKSPSCLGMVMMDFAGECSPGLIEGIINTN